MLNNVLYINTSSEKLQLAIRCNGSKIYKFIGKDDAKKHNATLLKEVETLLEKSKLKFADLDAIAVVIGPGSFTGIRIGVTTALALRRACSTPIVSVTSLEAVAIDEDCLSYLDCKHDNFYFMERINDCDRYFNGTIKDLNEYKGKKCAVKSNTLKEFIACADKKIEKGEFSKIVQPYYQKKSSAERENDQG